MEQNVNPGLALICLSGTGPRSFGSEGGGRGEGLAVRNLKLKCRERWQSQLVLGTLDRITGIDDLAINEIVTKKSTRHELVTEKSTRYQLMTLAHLPFLPMLMFHLFHSY